MNNYSIRDAILGGNGEIVHLIEQKGIQPTKECIESAINGHHNDIIDWLLERFPSYRANELFIDKCVSNMNIHGLMQVDEIFIYRFLEGINDHIKNINIVAQTIIKYASECIKFVEECHYGDIEVVKKYLSENADVNCETIIKYEEVYESPQIILRHFHCLRHVLMARQKWLGSSSLILESM